jgi:hypothetical protein
MSDFNTGYGQDVPLGTGQRADFGRFPDYPVEFAGRRMIGKGNGPVVVYYCPPD